MKKILSALLAVLILFSVPALAADDLTLFYGCWVSSNLTDSGLSQTILYLSPDETAFCSFLRLDAETKEPGFTRFHVGRWYKSGDGIHIESGKNTSMDAFLTDGGYLAEKLGGGACVMYGRADEYARPEAAGGTASLSDLETGVLIPAGRYLIGQDIPAGSYRFEMNHGAAMLTLYKDADATFYFDDVTLSAANPVFSRLALAEGQVLRVDGVGVIMSYAPALFAE